MLARLIIPSLGPNPRFISRLPESDDNPRDRLLPAGTLLVGPWCWVHCCPDAKGVVRAEPADEECEQRVAKQSEKMAAVFAARKAEAEAQRKREELAEVGMSETAGEDDLLSDDEEGVL